jgi:hypothetical protein
MLIWMLGMNLNVIYELECIYLNKNDNVVEYVW